MTYFVQSTYVAKGRQSLFRRGKTTWLFDCGLTAGDTIVWAGQGRTYILAVRL